MSLLPGWDGAGMGGGEGGLLGRRVGKAEGEAVEMRAVNSVSIGLQLWVFFFSFLSKFNQAAPFSTSLFVTVELL